MIVHIMRHTAVQVTPNLCYGQTDVPLRATFLEEARRSMEQLKNVKFEQVFTSPLSRCTKLADYCGFPNAIRDNRLKEMHFGDWESTMIYENESEEVKAWFKDQLNIRAPRGESFNDLMERFNAFIAEQKAANYQSILIFSHGGIVLSAQLLTGKTFSGDLFAHLPPYGSLTSFTF